MLFTFHIEQVTNYYEDELVVMEKSHVLVEGSWLTNLVIQPEDDPVRWVEIKRLSNGDEQYRSRPNLNCPVIRRQTNTVMAESRKAL